MEYQNNNRGVIQNRDRKKQIIDFSGLKYGKITPTDIDGLIEYKDKAMMFFEYKYNNAELPHGQKLALERCVNDIRKAGKIAVAFICEHNVSDCNTDIDASSAIVRDCYYNGKWYHDGKRTVKQKADSFIAFVERGETA